MKSFKKFKNLTLSCSIRFLIIICLFSCELISSQLAQGESKFLGNIGLGKSFKSKATSPKLYGLLEISYLPKMLQNGVRLKFQEMSMTGHKLIYYIIFVKQIIFHSSGIRLCGKKSEPAWIQGLSNVEIREEVEEWISDFMARYPNTQYIEVINEFIIHDDGATEAIKNAFGGNGNTGLDWAIAIHQLARLYAPNAVLIANDYTILSNNSNTQTMTNKVAILNK